ncbi:hypothetical protein GGR28_002818 [Lewinella aquimaris]|uniref:DUF4174 domain-containing protein n=1 Tax=Neolewinella aquimaris TaxID=1835722 RepID=A0A840EDZ8_9BACT|nr:DUF4174 domain-containing protein [Neolewinella aquimaris]MBB4080188.1 hypothetical protein [Neolewinella aquimaris]
MKLLLPLILLTVLPELAGAQSPEDFRWKSRVVVLFTPAMDDPLFVEQYELLRARVEELDERQVQIVMATPNGERENSGMFLGESASAHYYDYFSAAPYQLELVLVGLDGTEKYRARNTITPVSVLLELIDGMPMRQRELKQGYGNESRISKKGKNIPPRKGGG